MKKTIIVYYSLEGNTDHAAKKIGEKLEADLLRIDSKKAYPDSGFRKFLAGGFSAVVGKTPALKPYTFDGAGYDRIILGFPVWAGNVTPPIRTFIKENDLKGKKIAAFACQGGSGAEKALEKLRACLGVEKLEAELILIEPKNKPCEENDQKIEAFCAGLRSRDPEK